MMSFDNPLIPITALVALTLFVLREILESFRQHRSRKRKIKAARTLLAIETEINYWAKKSITRTLETIKDTRNDEEDDYHYKVDLTSSGDAYFSAWYADDRGLAMGNPIPSIHSETLDHWNAVLAETDNRLFERTLAFKSSLAELAHVRKGLIEHVNEETPLREEQLLGFVDYGLRECEKIERSFLEFYSECTGSDEIPTRLR